MDTLTTTTFTIQEAAEQTGLSIYTLRYYEQIGLVMPIHRLANGHRRYSEQDILLIQTLNCWRLTGMPLDDIRRYVTLLAGGDAMAAQRRALLEAHRQSVLRQMDELQAALQVIDFKIKHCAEIERTQGELIYER
jgi:DNA-binding transcriptional MerR regulator